MSPDLRPIAVLAALEEELRVLARRLTRSDHDSPRLPLWDGELAGTPVVLVQAGVGKVAAALATQFVFDVRAPRCVLTIGLAGGVESQSSPGRVIVASGAVQHDVDARPLTRSRGVIPGRSTALFPADPVLAGRLMRAASAVVDRPGVVRSGVILTGDQIVTSREVRDRALGDFPGAACFDMETAAVAQVANQNGVPWGGLRITSDSADESFDLDAVLRFGAGTAAETFDRIIRGFLDDGVERSAR